MSDLFPLYVSAKSCLSNMRHQYWQRLDGEVGRSWKNEYPYLTFTIKLIQQTEIQRILVSDRSQLTALTISFQFGDHLPNTLSLARGQTFKCKNQKPACHRLSVTIGRGLGACLQGGPDVRPQHSWASCCCWRDKSFEDKTQSNGCQDPQRLSSIWQAGHAEQVVQSSGARQGWGAGISWTQGRDRRRDLNQVRRGRHPLLFSHSVMSDSLQPHGLQHARLPCLSPPPGVCSNLCPSSQWCHPTISSSVVPFSSCLQSFPASGSFLMSWFLTSGGQSIGVSASASVLPMNIQD